MQINWIRMVLSIALAGYGLFWLFKAFRSYQKIFAIWAWPETVGIILSGATDTNWIHPKGGKMYWAVFSFSYMASGSNYLGNFKIVNLLGLKGSAESTVDNHPNSSTFPVHYNPENRRSASRNLTKPPEPS